MMKKVNVIVRDANDEWRARVDGEIVLALIGALAADPWTIEELHYAVGRFMVDEQRVKLFRKANRRPGVQLGDACWVVDLAARLLITPCDELPPPVCLYLDAEGPSSHLLPYHLSTNWQITSQFEDWQAIAAWRRGQMAEFERGLDRSLLYGEVLFRFLAEEAARQCERLDRASLDDQSHRQEWLTYPKVQRVIRKAHAEWLAFIPQGWGQSIRDAMVSDEGHLEADLRDRAIQWVMMDTCPRALRESDTAFKQSAFSSNEFRLYHQLVRHLLSDCLVAARRQFRRGGTLLPLAIADLKMASDVWLSSTSHPGLMNRSPRQVIREQRLRIPLGTRPGEVLDCECPLCRMMAEEPNAGPSFWFVPPVDDAYFPFQSELPEPGLMELADDASETPTERIWERVKVSWEDSDSASPKLRLFTLAGCTAELIDDIRNQSSNDNVGSESEELNRLMTNLARQARSAGNCTLDAAVNAFCDYLDDLVDVYPMLAVKLEDLQDRTIGLLETAET